MFVNTYKYRQAAIHFQTYGCYDDGPEGTYQHQEYWKREEDRCINGYSVNGVWIPGKYYFYLNYCQIQIVHEKDKSKNDGKRNVSAERKKDFPKFWDLDYWYFMSLEIARNGITLQEYEKLPFNLNLNLDPDNINGGKNIVWLKGRGAGASFKAASAGAYNFFFRRGYHSFYLASDTAYLNDDGVYSKFLDIKSFVNSNTGFFLSSDVLNRPSDMSVRTSYKDEYGNEVGFMSEVSGVTLHNNEDAIRGKRGDFFLEELGVFANANIACSTILSAIKSGNKVFGMFIGYGTGGTVGADFAPMEEMFFDPDPYDILKFNNVFEEGMEDTTCGLFTPAYYDPDFTDEDGNSDIEKAKEYYLLQREKAKKSKKPDALLRNKAEKPFSPSEAILNIESNIFPIPELQQWLLELENRYQNLGTPGELLHVESKLKFKPNFDLQPIIKFPLRNTDYRDLSGCIIMYEAPLRKEGRIPSDLYYIEVDPYASEEQAVNGSLGAAYVMMQTNNIAYHKGDIMVASYVGRPAQQSDFNRTLFLLAEYYNAKICHESNISGGIVDYAKKHKLLDYLQSELMLAYDEKLKNTSVNKGYGVFMNEMRIRQANIYLKEWLLTQRGEDVNGNMIYNYQTIKDPALIRELIKYKEGGNFDRVSAFRLWMYNSREILYGNIKPKTQQSSKSKFIMYQLYGSRQ